MNYHKNNTIMKNHFSKNKLRLHVLSLLLGLFGSVFAGQTLVINNTAGSLETILPNSLFETGCISIIEVSDFQITGTINALDLRYIQNKKTKFAALTGLDLSASDMSPVTIDGVLYPSNEITAGTFDGFRTLQSIKIPNSITRIGNKAFAGCSALKIMPNSITYIGKQAFAWARALGDITLSTSLIEMDDECFAYCDDATGEIGLTSIELPASLTKIGSNVFANCNKLQFVIMHATTPPTTGSFGSGLGSSVSTGYKTKLYVPDASLNLYKSISAYSTVFDIKPLSEK